MPYRVTITDRHTDATSTGGPNPPLPMSCTALIIRPKDSPEIHVLECDGPRSTDATVYNYFGTYRPVMSFEEWCAQPEHHKDVGNSIQSQNFDSACRIARLIDAYPLPERHRLEILARIELLHPGCTGDILKTQPNLQSA